MLFLLKQFIRRTKHLKTITLTLPICYIFLIATVSVNSFHTHADTSQVNEKVSEDTTQEKDIEKISVVGKRPLTSLRLEMRKAKEDFYSVYNQHVSDSSYKVICKKSRLFGSNVKKVVCTPKYFSDKKSEMTRLGYKFGSLETLNDKDVAFAVKEIRKKAMEEIIALINSNEDVRKKYEKYSSSKQLFEKSHIATFGKNSMYSKNLKKSND